MRKHIIIMVLLLFLVCTACDSTASTVEKSRNGKTLTNAQQSTASARASNSSAEKTDGEIISDLEQSDSFWGKIASKAATEYKITELTIKSRETDPLSSDHLLVTVTTKSDFATYTGPFNLVYLYKEDAGYELNTIYQDYFGTYSDIKLPNNDFAVTYFENTVSQYEKDIAMRDIAILPAEGNDTICKTAATFDIRYEEEHYTRTVSGFYLCKFINGSWEIDLTEGWITLSDEYYYDQKNEITYHYSSTWNTLELINNYVEDGLQYYDRFLYYSFGDLNYKLKIEYGFSEKEFHVLREDTYIGNESFYDGKGDFFDVSNGPIDEATALRIIQQIAEANEDVYLIFDPGQYLNEALAVPGTAIISEQYVDENGLNVAKIVEKGTVGYEDALRKLEEANAPST